MLLFLVSYWVGQVSTPTKYWKIYINQIQSDCTHCFLWLKVLRKKFRLNNVMHVLKFIISLVTDKFIRLLTSTGIYHQPFIPWDEKSLIFTFLFYFRNGLPAEKQVEETRVWQRKDGKWQNIHIHRSENLSSPKK